jgi:hypothetical protein
MYGDINKKLLRRMFVWGLVKITRMSKKEFLYKYPEMNDNGEISKVKIELLADYLTHYLSKGDDKIKEMLEDYNKLILIEKRDRKIDIILLDQSLRRLMTNITEI